MVNCPVSGENNVVSVSSTCIITKDNFIPKSGQLIKMNHQITEAEPQLFQRALSDNFNTLC